MDNQRHTASINWFPGHMAKAKNELLESLKLVDVVAEIVDARVPLSSKNSEFSDVCKDKPRITVINKIDLINKDYLNSLMKFYNDNNVSCVPFTVKDARSKSNFKYKVKELMKDKLQNWNSRGMSGRKIRVMIVGVPNVGKSAFINSFAKSSKAKVENRPGVTRKNQWFTVDNSMEFLDTPGVLKPKIENFEVSYNLALTGAIKDTIIDLEDVVVFLVNKLMKNFPNEFSSRYKLDIGSFEDLSPFEVLECIGKKRGFLVSGGKIDTFKTAKIVLDEFKSGKIGKIFLDEI